MTLTLYYSPISCSMVPYIALTEAGASFDVKVVDFRRGEHLASDFLRLNPKHRVPVLVIDGRPLTENVAIQLWIARHFPAARLLPADDFEQSRAVSLLAWCASGIHPFLTPNVLPQRYCDLPDSAESVRRCAHRNLREALQVADDLLRDRDQFFDHFTLADAYFFWCFRRAQQFQVDVAALANCHRHFAKVSERASVQKLLAFEAATLQALNQA